MLTRRRFTQVAYHLSSPTKAQGHRTIPGLLVNLEQSHANPFALVMVESRYIMQSIKGDTQDICLRLLQNEQAFHQRPAEKYPTSDCQLAFSVNRPLAGE